MKGWITVLSFSLLAVCHEASINPPIPVLAPAPGLILNNGSRSAVVVLDAFLDINCPDSAKAWLELKQVASHYRTDKVSVIIHQVPLPYHRNAMVCTKGVHVIQNLKPANVTDYIDAVYNHNLFLSNAMTYTFDEGHVLDIVADIAVTATKVDKDTFKADIEKYDAEVIYAWKYATRRGVAGTPWYMVNDVDIGANPSTLITKDDWIEYLDGLLT